MQPLSLGASRIIGEFPVPTKSLSPNQKKNQEHNGGGFISLEFGRLLACYGLKRHRVRATVPRRALGHRTSQPELRNEPEEAFCKLLKDYNPYRSLHRLQSVLGFKAPMVYYRVNPAEIETKRRDKLQVARHRPKKRKPQTRQSTPFFRHFPQSSA